MLSFKKTTNIDAAIVKLLKFSKINHNSSIIITELEKHPDYPSLLALSDVLTSLDIENVAFVASFDELADVQCPFIAYTLANGGELLVVTEVDEHTLTVSNERWNKHKLNKEEFREAYSGVVLVAEPSSATANYRSTIGKTLASLRSPFLVTSLALVFILALVFHTSYLSQFSWQSLLLTLFKSAGLITSILLLVQSVDSNNSLVQAICKSGGKTDCSNILSSNAANVFEGLTWSEVGFFYFAGTWLLLMFGGGTPLIWLTLGILNFISLPYTFYSIHYQARVAKAWCVLCCTVQALLWLEFIPLVANFRAAYSSFAALSWGEVSTIIICLLTPVILWVILKPLLLKSKEVLPLKQQLRNFKYNTELFNKLLTEQPKYALPAEECSILLGNTEAQNIVTLVTNPNCPPCAEAHHLLNELLEQNDNIQARIIFKTDHDNPISRHLMALNSLPDKEIAKQALHDWYEKKQKNYEAWAKAYPVKLNETEFYNLDRQNDWCQLADITFTPTLLLNGYRIPQLYQIPDLRYMLA